MPAKKQILIGAHRGAMVYEPENTLAAFEKAIEQGAYRIEFDVRRTRDGHLVLMHDATADRTTDGAGEIARMTLAEVRRLRAGGTRPVPTFAEALACLKGRAKALPEIKQAGIAAQLVGEIRAAGMVADCTISSFLEDELGRCRQLCPELPIAYFLTEPKPFSAAEIVERLGATLLIVWPQAIRSEYLADAHAHGMHIRCGFNDRMPFEEAEALFHRFADMGVDEVSCGRPDWIARMIARNAAD